MTMSPTPRLSVLFSGVLGFLSWSTAALGQDQSPVFEWLDGAPFLIEEPADVGGQGCTAINVRYTGSPDVVLLKPSPYALAGDARLSATARLATEGGQPQLKICFSPMSAVKAVRTTLKLQVRWPAAVEQAAVERLVDVDVYRQAAATALPAAVVVPVVKYWWGGETGGRWASLAIAETSQQNRLGPIDLQQSAQALNPDGSLSSAQVRFVLEKTSLEAGRTALAEVHVSGHLQLGDTRTKARLTAPQLAQAAELDITLRTRLHWLWLLLFITAGVALGLFLRLWLEPRRARLAALARARQSLLNFVRLGAELRDPDYRAELDKVLERLEAELTEALTVEAVNTAVQRADGAVQGIMERVRAARADLQARCKALTSALRDPHLLPTSLRSQVRQSLDECDVVERALDRGLIAAPARRLEAVEARVREELARACRAWLMEFASVQSGFGPWPEAPLAAQGLAKAVQMAAGFDAEAASTAELLEHCRQLRATLAAGVVLAVHVELLPYLQDVLGRMEKLAKQRGLNADQLARLSETFSELAAELGDAQPDVLKIIQLVVQFRGSLRDVLEATPGHSGADFDAEGYEQVLTRLGVPAAATLAGDVTPRIDPLVLTSAAFVLRTEGLTAHRDGSIRLDPPVPDGWRVSWHTVPELAAEAGSDDAALVLRPLRAGSLRVTAQLIDTQGNVCGTVTQDFMVQPSPYADEAKNAARDVRRMDGAILAISLPFIVGGGYLIFEPGFVGTFKDLFLPLLWGFTLDVGINQVRAWGQPLTQLPLPGTAK